MLNLFELFVKIGVDDQASKNISNITGKLGKGLATAAKVGTKAVGVFYSDLGYGYSGSGSIPAYAPLVFEIEIVEKPE
jgi:hypothetical protein